MLLYCGRNLIPNCFETIVILKKIKYMKSFNLILIALAAITFSCKKNARDGAPGPTGETQYTKQGVISGTVTFTDENNKEQKAPFSYEYNKSINYNYIKYDTITNAPNFSYRINLIRTDIPDPNNIIYFDIPGEGVSKVVKTTPTAFDFIFRLNTIINNKLYKFQCFSQPIITNFKFDFATNHLTFDYTAKNISYGGTTNDGTMEGKVDVILNYLDYVAL